jgi:hypothetical protein
MCNGKPAKYPEQNVNPCWDKCDFLTEEEAIEYTIHYLGPYRVDYSSIKCGKLCVYDANEYYKATVQIILIELPLHTREVPTIDKEFHCSCGRTYKSGSHIK